MASYKGYGIAIVLLLIQSIVCHPLSNSSKEPTSEEYLLAKAKFQASIHEYSDKVLQILGEMLRDEKFVNSDNTEIKALRNFLTKRYNQYDDIEKFDHYLEFLSYSLSMVEIYRNLPENKITEHTKFIEELLSKYGLTKVAAEVDKEIKSYKEFLVNLKTDE